MASLLLSAVWQFSLCLACSLRHNWICLLSYHIPVLLHSLCLHSTRRHGCSLFCCLHHVYNIVPQGVYFFYKFLWLLLIHFLLYLSSVSYVLSFQLRILFPECRTSFLQTLLLWLQFCWSLF